MAKPQAAPKYRYLINDPDCRWIAGQQISPGQQYVYLTEAQAKFYLASGSVTLAIE